MQKRAFLWGAIALLALAALACSLTRQTTPAPQVTQPPGGEQVQPTPTPEAVEEAPPLEIVPDALQNVNSYRLRFVMRQQVEGKPEETVTMEQESTREPAARRIVIKSEGGENPGTVELVQIGDTSWMCFGEEGCIQTQQEEVAQFEELPFQPEDFSSSEYRYVGRDTVNGVRSRHYELTIDPVTIAAMAQGDITSVQADVWVSDEAGLPQYVTRFTIAWEGTQDGKKITGGWTYEIYDVNKPIKIEPPEGATGVPDDVPIYAGATGLTTMAGMTSYSCSGTVAEVAEFYRNEMPGMGWTAGEESAFGNMVTQEWTKEGRKASIMISSSEEGKVNVIITVEQP